MVGVAIWATVAVSYRYSIPSYLTISPKIDQHLTAHYVFAHLSVSPNLNVYPESQCLIQSSQSVAETATNYRLIKLGRLHSLVSFFKQPNESVLIIFTLLKIPAKKEPGWVALSEARASALCQLHAPWPLESHRVHC